MKISQIVDNVVAVLVLIIFVFILFGCAKQQPASETIADSAQQSLNAISTTLTKECKTSAIESQISATQTAIKATVSACQNEKEKLNQEKLRWQWAFIGVVLIVLANLVRKILK